MNPDDILLLGIKSSVVAFSKADGRRIWTTPLPAGGFGVRFVSLLSDKNYVFACTRGSLYCLDLVTGNVLWRDDLSGLGYGVASLALAGGGPSTPGAAMAQTLFAAQRDASGNPGGS